MALKTEITLRIRKDLQDDDNPEYSGNLLTMEVTEAVNIGTAIFVWHRDVESEFSPENIALFYSIASVAQMDMLPVGPGNMDEPFFRTSSLELVFETPKDLETALSSIRSEIIKLQRANDVMINGEIQEEYSLLVKDGDAVEVEVTEEGSSSSS